MDRRTQMLAVAGAAAAVLASLYLVVAPTYSSGDTLAQANGEYVYLLLAGLALVAAAPLAVAPGRRASAATASGAVLVIFSFVSAAIGVFFLPAGALLLLASWLTPARER